MTRKEKIELINEHLEQRGQRSWSGKGKTDAQVTAKLKKIEDDILGPNSRY